jgi:hypothetical protein
LLAGLCLTTLVYWRGLDGPFLLDDVSNLPQTSISAVSWGHLASQFFAYDHPYTGSRGLTRVSFALTQYLNGDSPRAFKYQNLLLHLINGLLVFWLLLLLMSQCSPLQGACPPAWIALSVAAIWLLHPLQVSTVLYAVQRLALLSTLFTLAALICYVKGRQLSIYRPWAGVSVAAIGVCGFTLLGMLSKETASLTPLLIALIELFIFRFTFIPRNGPVSSIVPALFVAIFAAPLCIGAVYAASHVNLFYIGGRDFNTLQRLLTQAHAIALYLKLIFVPIPAEMSLFHDDFPVTRSMDLATLLTVLLYAGAITLAFWLRRSVTWIGFGILWFFSCHALESTILPLELVFEHRNYLALLGPAIIVVVLTFQALNSPKTVRFRAPVLGVLTILLAFNTAARAMVWGDYELLMRTQYEQHPHSKRVLAGMITLKSHQRNNTEALRYVRELQAVSPIEAAPFLSELTLQCGDSGIDRVLFDKIIYKLQSGVVGPFTSNTLWDLALLEMSGRCPSITSEQMESLIAAALKAARFRGGSRCPVNAIAVQHHIVTEQWDKARVALPAALAICRGAGTQPYTSLVNNVLSASKASGHLSTGLALLSEAAVEPDKHDVTDVFPEWISAEMITPLGIAQLRAEGQ